MQTADGQRGETDEPRDPDTPQRERKNMTWSQHEPEECPTQATLGLTYVLSRVPINAHSQVK
jgi:hypothetical protein